MKEAYCQQMGPYKIDAIWGPKPKSITENVDAKLFIPFERELKRNLSFCPNFPSFISFKFSDGSVWGAHRMAQRNDEAAAAAEEINLVDKAPEVEEAQNLSQGDIKDVNICEENQLPSQQQEEEIIKKKYGGLLPKKPPLISKDNERAFFDSADWALGKVGAQKSKGPLEALRPKLQPTPHQQVRSRSAYAPADDGEDGYNSDNSNPGENQGSTLDGGIESDNHSPENQNPQN
ncbi:hypothetical protein Pfo_009521 [Paulownia fortunei]|nr:hypothetical protein Pfo_009521 [Paulownia fortunei]